MFESLKSLGPASYSKDMGAEERRLLPVLVLSVFLVCSAYGQDPAAGPPTEQSGEAASLTNAA